MQHTYGQLHIAGGLCKINNNNNKPLCHNKKINKGKHEVHCSGVIPTTIRAACAGELIMQLLEDNNNVLDGELWIISNEGLNSQSEEPSERIRSSLTRE